MKRQKVMRLLAEHKSFLREHFGVTELALFGSTVRDAASDNSDVDILVDFDGSATSARFLECSSTLRIDWAALLIW